LFVLGLRDAIRREQSGVRGETLQPKTRGVRELVRRRLDSQNTIEWK